MRDWFVIEGNIGSGKSTLCRMLQESIPSTIVFPEPVDLWKDMIDSDTQKNILQYYYEDQTRWSFAFQLYGLMTRMEDIMKEVKEENMFVERSIYSYKHVFARSLYEKGKMTSLEWKLYEEWFEWLSQKYFSQMHEAKGYIYIRADPQISYERMLKRERTEEKCVPLEYLENINRYHDEWLQTMNPEDILVIDVNEDFENTPEIWEKMKERILQFVQLKTS